MWKSLLWLVISFNILAELFGTDPKPLNGSECIKFPSASFLLGNDQE